MTGSVRKAKTVIHDHLHLTPASILDQDLYWKISLTPKRAGLILTEKAKESHKASDFNVAGQLKLSKLEGFHELFFSDPPTDTIKIQCELFGDASLEIIDPTGVTVEGFMDQVNTLYVHQFSFFTLQNTESDFGRSSFTESPKEKREAKGKDVNLPLHYFDETSC